VKVVSAGFDNGMLTIELVREIPEEYKPRKIAIADALGNTDNVQALEQRQAA
jgi:molecular chaperone IbpA